MNSGEVNLLNVGDGVWNAVTGDGRVLCTLWGTEHLILGPAAASLVADHRYPRGTWRPAGTGRYVYETTAAQ